MTVNLQCGIECAAHVSRMPLCKPFGGGGGCVIGNACYAYLCCVSVRISNLVGFGPVHVTSRLVAAERRLDFRGRFVQFRIVHVDVQLLCHLLGDLLQILFVLQHRRALGGQLARQMAAEGGLNAGGRIAELWTQTEKVKRYENECCMRAWVGTDIFHAYL